MIANIDPLAGRRLAVTSPEHLDTTVAEVVRLKIKLTQKTAEKPHQQMIICDLFAYVVSGFNPVRSELRFRRWSRLR